MTGGSFDHIFPQGADVPGGKAFRIRRRRPIDVHRAEYEKPSCPACYRPGLDAGYCDRCEATGASERHREMREAGW